jgi:CheY-like chemotaxis protein
MGTILILEQKEERQEAFKRVAPTLGMRVKIWEDAAQMQAECEKYLDDAVLISLEQDLDAAPGQVKDPGTGLDVAKYLAERQPVCPVIVHTANTDRSFSIYNELRFANWLVDRVPPVFDRWIERHWMRKAIELLAAHNGPRQALAA